MTKLNIALLAGGDSSEREVSLGSARQVLGALDKNKYNVWLVDVRGRDWHCTTDDGKRHQVDLNDFSISCNGVKTVFDYALIMIHGSPGEDGRMQGYLDMMNVPYSSCGLVSTVVTFDKAVCKKIVSEAGIPVARQIYINRGDSIDTAEMVERLGLPMFIKPNASGSSFGVTKVKTADEIQSAIEKALEESDAVLAEEFVDGREFGCGLFVGAEKEIIFPVTEIISKKEFFDYEAKYTPGFSDEITPADIPAELSKKIQQYARTAYKVCDCRGVVRIDFIVTGDGVPVMVEINSVPGMSAGSIVPKQVEYVGMTLGQLFDAVIADTYTKKR